MPTSTRSVRETFHKRGTPAGTDARAGVYAKSSRAYGPEKKGRKSDFAT
jgi:hypothetical protein